MQSNSHPKVLGGLVLSAALLLSACGASGGSDNADKKDDKTTTTVKETTTTEAKTTTTVDTGDAEAQARADSVDITVSDFPDGWTATPHEGSADDSPIKSCDPTFSDDSTTLAKHSTDDFQIGSLDKNDGSQFAGSTKVFEDEAAAKEAIAPFNDADVISCIDQKLKETFGDGTNGITIDGTLANDDIEASQLGVDESEGLSAEYKISATDGSKANANIGVLAMRTGDIVTVVSIISVGDSLDESTLGQPLSALAKAQAAA